MVLSLACSGPHPGCSPRLPTHDRVAHDIRDAEEQEHGSGGVASIMETTVPHARAPQEPLPDVGSALVLSRPPVGEASTWPLPLQSVPAVPRSRSGASWC
jgi:hypothetical protein